MGTDENAPAECHAMQRTAIDAYRTFLKEPSRPPSRGGNGAALHSHVLTIGGKVYSFLASGGTKWVYKSDTVQFDWAWDPTKKYRNIAKETLIAWDKNGDKVVRGNRASRQTMRTATTRLPGRRRDWKD